MKSLDRPSGYFTTFDPKTGEKVEGEMRTCVHCGFTWVYDPKNIFNRKLGLKSLKPKIRGTCLSCNGLVCAMPACLAGGCKPYMQKIEEAEARHRKSAGGILLLGG